MRTDRAAGGTRDLARRALRSRLAGALTYPHGVDRYLELVRPLAVSSETRAEVISVRRQTARSVTLELRPNASWRGLRAGQFVSVGVEIDGVRHSRPYSPAGPEQLADGRLELTVSTHPDGRVSRHLREHARPGAIVWLSQAQGEFVLPPERPQRVLLISGGSGITPVMAMLRSLCEEGYRGEVGFLNYARSPELALYARDLEGLAARNPGVRVARGYTRAGAGALGGRFRREHLGAVVDEHRDAATFVCGPPALIEAVGAVWASDGLPAPAVETFTPLPFMPPPGGPPAEGAELEATGTVSFAKSSRAVANSGLVLLEQAEDAGLDPAHGCRMGICNTCACRKRSGSVRNVLTGAVSSAPDEQIRICVAAALGDVVLDL